MTTENHAHGTQADGMHTTIASRPANAAARLALTNFPDSPAFTDAVDTGKIARDEDTGRWYCWTPGGWDEFIFSSGIGRMVGDLLWDLTATAPMMRQEQLTTGGTGQSMRLFAQTVTGGAGANIGGELTVEAGLSTVAGVAASTGGVSIFGGGPATQSAVGAFVTTGGSGYYRGGFASGTGGTGTCIGGDAHLYGGPATNGATNTGGNAFAYGGTGATAYGNVCIGTGTAPAFNSMANGIYITDATAEPVALALNGSYLWCFGTQLNPVASATKNGFESAADYVRLHGTAVASVNIPAGAGYTTMQTTVALIAANNTSRNVAFAVTHNQALASLDTVPGSAEFMVARLNDGTQTITSEQTGLSNTGATPTLTGFLVTGVGWQVTLNANGTVTFDLARNAGFDRAAQCRYWYGDLVTQVAP